MSPRTLDLRSALIVLLSEIRYSLSRAQAHPLAATHAPVFQTLREDWTEVQAKELALQEAIAVAQAKVDAVHYDLADFADRFSKAVLTVTKDDREHPIYVHFFGKKTLSDLKRSLPELLGVMRNWSPVLKTTELTTLKAMSAELETLITKANDALEAKRVARQKNRQFRDVGERKQFIDKVNAKRKEVYGLLAKLPHEQLSLPSSFADHFFRREGTHGDDAEEKETIESVKDNIAALNEELKEQAARLAALEAEEAAVKKAAAELEAAKAELDALEKQMDAAEAKAEALRAKIGKR